MATDTVQMNAHGIVLRPLTKILELKIACTSFANDLFKYLDRYEMERLNINRDSSLSAEGRVAAMMNLQAALSPSLTTIFLPRIEKMAVGFNARLLRMLEVIRYAGDPSPLVETTKQIEARQMLEKFGMPELIGMLHSENTSAFLFTAFISAPVPLLPDAELERGVEMKIKRVAPEILDYRDGIEEILVSVVNALARAYRIMQQHVPSQLANFKPVTVDFVKVLAAPKIAA